MRGSDATRYGSPDNVAAVAVGLYAFLYASAFVVPLANSLANVCCLCVNPLALGETPNISAIGIVSSPSLIAFLDSLRIADPLRCLDGRIVWEQIEKINRP